MKKFKRILSVVLAFSLLTACFYFNNIAKAEEQVTFTEMTLSSFGLSDGDIKNASKSGVYGDETLDGVAVILNITFPKVNKNYYYIGGESQGIRFEAKSTGKIDVAYVLGAASKKIITLDAATAGVSALTQTQIKLKTTFEFGEVVSGKTDLKLGIYINDKLYGNTYQTVTNCAETNLQQKIGFVARSATISVSSAEIAEDPNFVPETLPTNLIKTTFNDYGVGNGKVTWAQSVNKGTIMNNIFSGYITFSGKNMWFQYGGKGEGSADFWKGMRFAYNGENIVLSHSAGEFSGSYTFYPALAKVDFESRFLIQLTTVPVDSDNDGAQDDVKLGVWFNGTLYKNEYIYLKDAVDKFGKNFALLQKDQQFDQGHAIVESYVKRSETTEVFPADLESRTFFDYNTGNRTTNWFTKIMSGSTLNTAFSGYITPTGNMWFQYGGKGYNKDAFWYGIRFNFDGTKIIMSSSNGEFRGSYVFTSDIAGTELYDNKYLFQVTTRVVDSDNDGVKDDVQIGVWFNGVLYDNTYIYLVDAAEKLGNNLAVIQPNQKPSAGHMAIESIKKTVDFTVFGFTNNWAKELGLK